MAKWYIKDFGKLTGVSVRTLHHYDKINLLKPSIRLENSYRMYSEADLLKLQQILALKFFGFELSQIKDLLLQDVNMIEHFAIQSQLLQEKARTISEASKALDLIIEDGVVNKSIAWEKVIKLIEVYRMTQAIEKSWAGKILNQDELKEYVTIEQNLKNQYTEKDRHAFENAWGTLLENVKNNLTKDPTSSIGVKLGKQCMDLVNTLYGKQHVTLRNTIWEKGYKQGKMDGEHYVAPEVISWLDQGISSYYKQRIYSVLKQIDSQDSNIVLKQFNELLEDMCGNDKAAKDELLAMAQKDDNISVNAKIWLKKIFN